MYILGTWLLHGKERLELKKKIMFLKVKPGHSWIAKMERKHKCSISMIQPVPMRKPMKWKITFIIDQPSLDDFL